MIDEKDKLGKSPTKEEKKQLEALAIQAQKQLLNTKNLAVQQSTEFRSDLIQKFRKEVADIAQDIASRAGSKLVLVSNYETIWFDPWEYERADNVVLAFLQKIQSEFKNKLGIEHRLINNYCTIIMQEI